MKYFLLMLFSAILFTDAVEVTDEDINSPLVSYLLAKVQRLEAKMMAKPNVRNTREVEKHSVDTNTSADDKKLKIAHSKWLLISDGETLLVHMELILFTKKLLQEAVMIIKVHLLIFYVYLLNQCIIQITMMEMYQCFLWNIKLLVS